MRRSQLPLAVAVAAAALLVVPVAAGAATAHHATATPQVTGTREVPGVLLGLSRAKLESAAPAGRSMTIGVGVSRPDPAAEKAAYDAMYDPKSPSYHHFLTSKQFDDEFGVRPATSAAVRSWLTGGGLRVDSVSADGSYVEATGTVAQLEKLFRVSIGRYHDRQEGTFLANDVAPTVPNSLPVTAVAGLDTVQRVRTAVDASGQQPHKTAATSGDFDGVFTPQNLWSIYDQPSSDEGEGQTMGIFGEGATDPVVTQLRLFEQRFGLPKIPVQTVFTQPNQPASADSPGTGGDESGNIEWYLDAQASTGMAPKAKELQFWFSNTLFDPDIAQSFAAWVDTPSCTPTSPIATGTSPSCAPMQMNASFGECETGVYNPVAGPLAQLPYGTELGDDLEPIAEPLLQKATMMGRTLFAAAGDTGSGCPEVALPVIGAGNGVAPQPAPILNYPCTSQFAVCVGGTVLHADDPAGTGKGDQGATSTHNTRTNEISWQDTGGGSSHYILQPSFQAKANLLTPTETLEASLCPTDPSGNPHPQGSVCRTAPDVAALSGNITGNAYFIYIDGEPSSEGGTSLSSPLTMGMWTRLQAAAPTAAGNGFADETYYPAYTAHPKDFFDITCVEEAAGNDPVCQNGGPSGTNGFYQAGPGYDFTSGLGVPDIGKLLTDVEGTQTARYAATAPETDPQVETTVTDSSPTGNTQNPVVVNPLHGTPLSAVSAPITSLPAVDLTKTTITTSPDAKTVTVTMTGPTLSATPDPQSASGESFVYYWYEAATHDVYFLEADTSPGSVSYSAGDTAGGSFTANSAVTVTGSFTGNTLTMSAPLAKLGAPAPGSLLEYPAAETQATPLGSVTDYAASTSTSTASVGQAVCVGGCNQAPATTPTGTTTPTGGVTPAAPSGGTTPRPAATGQLAFTGLSAALPLVALVLVAAGLAGAYVTRRRAHSR